MELQSPKPNRLSREDLDRLLGGEDSAEVHALLEEWRALSREGDDPLDMLAGALNATFGLPPRTREDILWRASQILGVPGRSTISQVSRPQRGVSKKHPLRRLVWSYTAGVAVSACLIVLGWIGVSHRVERGHSPAMATYATANGQRATITLTDGNTVTLNVASRLWVPADYATGDHTVRLIGEALFTVVHHDGTPFTVMAGPTVTRVLGTSFVVRRYETDTATMVAVGTGKVTVGAAIVTQDRLLEIGPSGVAHAAPADASEFGFATGVLVLQRMPLSQAIPALDRWYDADIRLGDAALNTKPIEGNVTTGSLADLVERLEVLFDVRVVRDGRVLTLYPR
ncbi:MAG TPA: FecR domain-containing protein [Gemmatimonadaceae bacterium]|nr:FecR domain-containing protein [Gemmatimonadaceae bacterium]